MGVVSDQALHRVHYRAAVQVTALLFLLHCCVLFESSPPFSALCSIVPASQLVQGSDYYLFKEGIKPLWEEDNVRGGRWTIPIDKRHRQQRMDNYWPELIGAMAGEQFGDDGDQICGAMVSVRFRFDVVGSLYWTSWMQLSNHHPFRFRCGPETLSPVREMRPTSE